MAVGASGRGNASSVMTRSLLVLRHSAPRNLNFAPSFIQLKRQIGEREKKLPIVL